MKQRYLYRDVWLCLCLLLAAAFIAACGNASTEPQPQPAAAPTTDESAATPETEPEPAADTSSTPETSADTTEVITDTSDMSAAEETAEEGTTEEEEPADVASGGEQYTTPHPILSDVRVRHAIAHCTNRPQLIEAVYPFLDPEEQEALLMDTFLPQGHWALAEDAVTYPFDPQRGSELLEAAGWILEPGTDVRTNAEGEPLVLNFLTTNAQFRITWSTVFEQQLLSNCGIQIVRTHAPGSFVFGDTTGLQVRDFELGAFAWVGSVDPKGATLYACNQVPLPSNNWEGQNYMGWCNEEASRAIVAANSTLDRAERIEQYGIVQRAFAEDMVSLPVFNRLSVAAARNNLLNYRPDPTEYFTTNIDEWDFANNEETIVIGMVQEPETLFWTVNSFSAGRVLYPLLRATDATTYNYDYQAAALQQLPTLENGGAVLSAIEVQEGDAVWSVDGEAVELAPGVELIDPNGETIVYEGGIITLPQLSVTFEYVEGITWEDGEPLKQADFELGQRIYCDPETGTVSYRWCESIEDVEFLSDTSYTITYLPGAQWPEYSVYNVSYYYPSHQILSDGRRLADVPASEWATLPEVAETPLSTGPYRIVEWEPGQRIVFAANPFYYKGEVTIKNATISFIADSNQAVAQLLNGNIDVINDRDLSGGGDVEVVLGAAEEGQLQAFTLASPTWEHVDMNLYTR